MLEDGDTTVITCGGAFELALVVAVDELAPDADCDLSGCLVRTKFEGIGPVLAALASFESELLLFAATAAADEAPDAAAFAPLLEFDPLVAIEVALGSV